MEKSAGNVETPLSAAGPTFLYLLTLVEHSALFNAEPATTSIRQRILYRSVVHRADGVITELYYSLFTIRSFPRRAWFRDESGQRSIYRTLD